MIDDIYTVSLLANGRSTIFDESGKSWTAAGDAAMTTTLLHTCPSIYFDGVGDYIHAADSADWRLDGGSNSNKWTVDLNLIFDGDPGTGQQGLFQQYVDINNYWGVRFNNNTVNIVVRTGGSTLVNISNSWNPASATLYHFAIVKDGTNGYMMFVNGAQIGTTQTDTDVMGDYAGTFRIGVAADVTATSYYFKGWMSRIRVSKGIARWTADFTVPNFMYLPKSGGIF